MRQDVAQILRTSNPSTPNLPFDEISALKQLRHNENILILRTHKRNYTVITKISVTTEN